MPRPPDPKSKHPNLIVEGKNEDEEIRIRAFKRICALDGLAYRREILQLIDTWLRKHNWPPGNPQTQMPVFTDKQLVEKRKCEHPNCPNDADYIGFTKEKTAKPKVYLCEEHKKHALENRLLKSYRPLKK